MGRRRRTPVGPRDTAARVVAAVLNDGRSLNAALAARLSEVAPEQRPLVQEIAYGTLRWHPRLASFLRRLVARPMKTKDRDVEALLLGGLYQLESMDIQPYAVVSSCVDAAEALGKDWAKGLVNAVMRRFLRERDAVVRAGGEEALYAHPIWLLDAIRTAWPDDWAAIVQANNARPPLTLRVNRRRTTAEAYGERLEKAGMTADTSEHAPDALVLRRPVAVEKLPGFSDGEVSVQDAAAQLAAPLLAARQGMRLLDACAAPGGKTGHILETCPQAQVLALDVDERRLEQVRDNLKRLRLDATVIGGDAAGPAGWWDGEPFDRILLDAPCTGTGVIRRHPDIKVLRRPEDVEQLVSRQAEMLRALWPLLKPGGMLVYATCSVLPVENERQVSGFLAEQADARDVTPAATWGRAVTAGRQILPGEDGMDGFYYACLAKP